MKPVIGILLAAGAGTRFGGNKLLQPLANGELLAVQCCRKLAAETDQVLAVIRPGNDRLQNLLTAAGAQVQVCEDAAQGMGTSLACGIRASADAAGWVIALADMPWLKSATIARVTAAVRAGALIAAPVWQGQRGHPVGFSALLGPALGGLTGDSGAKAIIQAHRAQLQLLECDDPGIIRDIDTPDDLTFSESRPSL